MNDKLNKAFEEISLACAEIEKMNTDNNFLCEVLNSLDKTSLSDYYRSDRNGPVVNIRKEVCKEVLLNDITPSKLEEIMKSHKSKNPNAFRSWKNDTSILNSLLVTKYDYLKEYENIILEFLKESFDNKVNDKVWDFRGSRNQGQDHYCLLVYNQNQENQSTGLQFYLDFTSDGKIRYGLWKESEKKDISERTVKNYNQIDSLVEFISKNKDIIINDIPTKKSNNESNETFLSAAIKVLKMNNNKPMSSSEIWDIIEKNDLYRSSGKTPAASLNTVLHSKSINSNISSKSKHPEFECVGTNPIKFKLIHYMSDNIRKTLLSEGFITIDMLRHIFKQNNININI